MGRLAGKASWNLSGACGKTSLYRAHASQMRRQRSWKFPKLIGHTYTPASWWLLITPRCGAPNFIAQWTSNFGQIIGVHYLILYYLMNLRQLFTELWFTPALAGGHLLHWSPFSPIPPPVLCSTGSWRAPKVGEQYPPIWVRFDAAPNVLYLGLARELHIPARQDAVGCVASLLHMILGPVHQDENKNGTRSRHPHACSIALVFTWKTYRAKRH